MTVTGMDGSAPPLVIALFGPFEVRLHGAPLPRPRSRTEQWLLALLALRHGREVERAWLAGTLWPESPGSQSRYNLRRDLTNLRRALGPEAGRLRSSALHTLCLDLTGAQVDVVAFDQALALQELPALETAVSLYRGPLLEGCTEEWAFQERQIREQAYLTALETLAAHAMAEDQPAAAERHLRRAVAVDPLRETALRALMQALAAGGNFAAATLAYRDLRLRLHCEINAEPDAETLALYQRIRTEARARAGGSEQGAGVSSRSTSTSTEALPSGPWPLAVPAAVPSNLPLPLTSFIGREEQIAEVQQSLAAYRLVTLTGAGGCGKTRLALRVATELLDQFAAGVRFVELAPLADASLVPQAVAAALDVQETPGRPLVQTLTEYLRPRKLLLVLDNCEHLAGACAQLVESLLQSCSRLQVLATSREALGIVGESRYRVPSLSVPNGGPLPIVEEHRRCEAVRLFIERAAAAQPQFALSAANAPSVAQICRQLDGIPLALELAASLVRALPVAQIAERLEDRFRLLTGGSRTALPRHQTLRALIDWSYDLLSEPERSLLRRLSVFAGGWTLEAAEAVCSDFGLEVLDLQLRLADKSLVMYEEQRGEGRYWLLETVRQYGRDRLLGVEAEAVRGRHRDFYLQLAERAEIKLRGPEQLAWLERLDREHDNLRAALEWCGSAEGGARAGLQLAVALWWFWMVRNHFSEGRQWLEGALSVGHDAPPPLRAQALAGAAYLAQFSSDAASAERLAAECLPLARGTGEQWVIAWVLFLLGTQAADRGDDARAMALGEESLAAARVVGDRWLAAEPLFLLGMAARSQGDCEAAAMFLEESLSLLREAGDRWSSSLRLHHLSLTAEAQGRHEQAAAFSREEMAVCRELGDRRGIVWCLSRMACTEARKGQAERAVQLQGAAESLREASGCFVPAGMRVASEQSLEAARAALGEADFAAAWAAGRALTLDEAAAFALAAEM